MLGSVRHRSTPLDFPNSFGRGILGSPSSPGPLSVRLAAYDGFLVEGERSRSETFGLALPRRSVAGSFGGATVRVGSSCGLILISPAAVRRGGLRTPPATIAVGDRQGSRPRRKPDRCNPPGSLSRTRQTRGPPARANRMR